MYKHEWYKKLIEQTIANIKELSELKGGEYAGDEDRLANFRRNGARLGLPMETVWAVYAAKHWDAIQQYVSDLQSGKTRQRLESIEGRADDLIVYLILFKAMCDERFGPTVEEKEAKVALQFQLEKEKAIERFQSDGGRNDPRVCQSLGITRHPTW